MIIITQFYLACGKEPPEVSVERPDCGSGGCDEEADSKKRPRTATDTRLEIESYQRTVRNPLNGEEAVVAQQDTNKFG